MVNILSYKYVNKYFQWLSCFSCFRFRIERAKPKPRQQHLSCKSGSLKSLHGHWCPVPLTMSAPAAVGDVAAAVVSSQLQAADTTAVVGRRWVRCWAPLCAVAVRWWGTSSLVFSNFDNDVYFDTIRSPNKWCLVDNNQWQVKRHWYFKDSWLW